MTLYVLTRGEYSDYRIEGIYSTRELAERYEKFLPKSQNPYIEEWEIDKPPLACSEGYTQVWRVWTGNDGEDCVEEDADDLDCYGGEMEDGCLFDVYKRWNNNGTHYSLLVSKEIAKDKEHALKIFHDKIAAYKAREAGIY